MTNGHTGRVSSRWILLSLVTFLGCSAAKPQGNTPPGVEAGISLTPPAHYTTYYSTQKARALGESYGDNLDRLLERLTQSPVGQMQFSNAIVSLSLGFFTHSASRPPDERYLEVILGMPDILEEEADINATVSRLFAQYGREILAILASDTAIAEDLKVAGYGLNFSWRNMLRTPSGPRMAMKEAVIYIPKKKSERFLKQQIDHDELLGTSTIFVRQGENPSQQVRYLPPPSQPWLQPPPSLVEAQTVDPQEQGQRKEGAASRTARQPEQQLAPDKPPLETVRRAPLSPPPRRVSPEEQLFDPPTRTQEALAVTTLAAPPGETLPPPSRDGGYLVQLSLSELLEAQRWADFLKEKGYVTSLVFLKEDRPIRLRVGHFVATTEATQFLDYFKARGVQGLILQNSR
jgi:hypothetical protein